MEHVGLTSEEAQKRIGQYGQNMVAEEKTSEIKMFLHKFWGIVPWMLEAAIIINLCIGKWAEAILIIILLLFQAVLGFYQERKAKHAIALLKQRLSVFAKVNRDGKWQTLPASELVPGDFVRMQSGDIVPADVNISDGEILADQSQLTGESLPVEIKQGKTAYAGSLITQGEAYGIVSATGAKTYYGKTASLIRLAEKPPLLQQLALKISKTLLILDILLALAAMIFMVNSGISFSFILPFVLMLLVLSVPIALPAMSALSVTIATHHLAEKGVLTARLSAIEDAAAMDILCIDKTGTLTENRPTVEKVASFSKYSEDEILRLSAITVEKENKELLNLALVQAAQKRGLLNGLKNISIIKNEPFDPRTKASGAWISYNKKKIHIMKGEPRSIAKLCGTQWSKIAKVESELSGGGNRVIAVAAGTGSKIDMIGLISLADPIRQDSAELVSFLKKQGIRVVLLTGDSKETAEKIAANVNIICSTAPENIDYEKVRYEDIKDYNVFSRILPQDKYWILKALQDGGHVVGMTGDGINDAPALRQASVGIATQNATDVAKSSAGLVLTQPGLINIQDVVKISRSVHQRINHWVLGMITRKIAIPTFITLNLLIFKEFAISSFLAFIFMFFGDIVTFSFSKDNVHPSQHPNRWDIRQLTTKGIIYAISMILMGLGIFWIARYHNGLAIDNAQTIIFVWLVLVGGQAALYLVRVNQGLFWSKPFPGIWFVAASIFTIALTATMSINGWLMSPISISWFIGLFLSALGYLIVNNAIIATLERTAFKDASGLAAGKKIS